MKRRQSSSSSSSSSSASPSCFWWWWWWLLLRRTSSRTSFSRSSCVLVVSVCSSSPTRRSLCSPARLFARMCVIVCVCVFQFPLFAAVVVVFFFGGLTVSNAALLAHFVSSFSFLRCNSRGSLSPLFFTYRTKHVHTCTRTDTDTQTDGRTEGEKCARAASFGKHTQNYFAFFIVVCYCYYYDWLLLLFTFHGMLLGVINKQRQSALHAHTLVTRGWGELFTIFQLFRDALFGNLLLRLRRLPLLP